jgi:hypothetical protein
VTLLSASDLKTFRDQALRLSESQRMEIASALLDSLRPPSQAPTAEELHSCLIERAERYHSGNLAAISSEESRRQAWDVLARNRPT